VCIVVSCLVCIVVVDLCVLLSSYVNLFYYVGITVFTLDTGLLARSQYLEGPATGHLDTGFSWFPCVYKANAEMVPNIPSCHYMLLMQPSRLKFISNQFHILYKCKITTATG
jgi:hypothetical protein